jgi:hypothetical protein
MRAVRFIALVSGAGLLAAVLVAPPAVADRYIEGDPAGDMVEAPNGTVPEPDEVVAAPGHRRLDIRRVFVRHTARVLIIRVVVRALARPEGEGYFLGGFVQVDRQARPLPDDDDPWQWAVIFDEEHVRHGSSLGVYDADFDDVPGCQRGDGDVDAVAHYNGNWITVSIPRGCLAGGDSPAVPEWVRAAVHVSHGVGLRSYADRLWRRSPDPWLPVFANRGTAHFTPRLYAG